MQNTDFPSLADHVAMLPAAGPARERQLRRLIEISATTEAAAVLHAAAGRLADRTAIVSRVLTAADEILTDETDAARDRLLAAVVSPEFVPLVRDWIRELREVASALPDSGACTVATALTLWGWTLESLRGGRNEAIDELAASLCPLVAARSFVLDVVGGSSELRLDLCHVYAAHVSASAGATCAELVYGYRRHLTWDAEGCATCYGAADLDDLEAIIPGIASGARASFDVIEADGSHPAKRGPCVRFESLERFTRLRSRLDGCLTGARTARDRAANAMTRRS